jgi:molybdopterin converting factor small subunit
MKLLRLKPGHGEILLAEGDVEVAEEERELIEAFRRELDAGMWAAVPTQSRDGRREAELVKSFEQVPRDADRVIFFPRAAGGARGQRGPARPAAPRRPTR